MKRQRLKATRTLTFARERHNRERFVRNQLDLEHRGEHVISRRSLLKRGLVPLLVVAFLKVALALLVSLIPGKTSEPWNIYQQSSSGWSYLFSAWDSAYYFSIATNWYPAHFAAVWAYFPLYPLIIRLLGVSGLDRTWIAMTVGNIVGLASIPVFQAIAGNYLSNSETSYSTILYFLLPPVFVFTTVSYPESLFLLLSLLTWYTHIKGRNVSAIAFAALTSLTKSYGLLILLPIAFNLLRFHKYRIIPLLAVPVLVLVGWFLYAFSRTGVFFAPITAEAGWNTATVLQIQHNIVLFLSEGDIQSLRYISGYWEIILIGILFFSLVLILTFRVWKIDRSLGIFSAVFLLAFSFATILFLPTFASVPRYLSATFPTGIALHTKRGMWFLLVAMLFVVMDLLGWWLFLFSTVFH